MRVVSSPVHLVLLQPSPFCNIDCTYCYLPNREVTTRMSSAKLREVFSFLFRRPEMLASQLRILWHSGEPLTSPISFYREALEVQQQLCPATVQLTNSFQTNGTLLNVAWVNFVLENRFTIGVSLDGPEEFHDRKRVTRSGKGTFARAAAGIRLLVKAGIPFHVITVLNDQTLDYPERLWDTYRTLGITRMHFLIEELQGVHTIRQLRRNALQGRLERFFTVLDQKRAEEGNEAIFIRELDSNRAKLTQLPTSFREIEQVPLGILSITHEGDVATLSPDLVGVNTVSHGRFVFANTASGSLESMLDHPNFLSSYRSILSGYVRCKRSCSYFELCGGGQPSIKLFENGTFDSTETPSCQMRIKAAVNVVLRRLPQQSHTYEIDRLCERLGLSGSPDRQVERTAAFAIQAGA